jgi:CBS domain-containing protein
MEIGSIMTTVLTSVKPDTPLTQAGALMNARRVKQLPVLDADRLVGVVSSHDVAAGILFRSIGY